MKIEWNHRGDFTQLRMDDISTPDQLVYVQEMQDWLEENHKSAKWRIDARQVWSTAVELFDGKPVVPHPGRRHIGDAITYTVIVTMEPAIAVLLKLTFSEYVQG